MNLIITQARTRLLVSHPFFGAIALGLKLVETTEVPTMATDGRSLLFNPDFIEKRGVVETTGVLAHEVMHVVFKHHLRRAHRDPMKYNVAADYAVNATINTIFTLPDDHLFDAKYINWSTENIYADLPDEDTSELAGLSVDWGQVTDLTTNADGTKATPAELSAIEETLDSKIFAAAQTAKNMGNLPSSVAKIIDDMRKPQVHWPTYIRRALGGEIPDDYTWAKLNRKWFSGYGIYMPAILKFGAGDIVVIVDTSGSVNRNEQQQFLGEMSFLSAELGANSITVIGCDAAVQTVETYNPGETIRTLDATGGGGTRAKPAFDYLAEYGYTPNAVIYFTDGGIFDLHELTPPNYDVIWATTEPMTPPFGECIPIEISELAA